LTRFLSWAFPNLRGVVRPKRLCSSPLGSANSTKERETFLAPLSYTTLNSPAFRNFKPFGDAADFWMSTVSKHSIVLDRDPLTTLVSPCFQHEPTSTCLHALPESMSLCAPSIIRLIGSQRHLFTLLRKPYILTYQSEKSSGFMIENEKRKCYPFAVSHATRHLF